MNSKLTSDMTAIVTLMGGGRIPLLKPAANSALLAFFIPTAYKSSPEVQEGGEKFVTTWMQYFRMDEDAPRGGAPYCTSHLGSVVFENLINDWANFGYIIPRKDVAPASKNKMTWDLVGNDGSEYFSKYCTDPPQSAVKCSSSELTGRKTASGADRHVLYIRTACNIQNCELLCYNDVQYLLEAQRLQFFRMVFIPLAPHNIGCWMNKLKCDGCSLSGLCDMGQIPIGFLSISRDAIDNPVYKARLPLNEATISRNINRIKMPRDLLIDSLPKLSGDLSALSIIDILALKDNILPSSQEGFIKVVTPNVSGSYTHMLTLEARSEHIESDIESILESEGSEDTRMVLAHRGMFDYLPKLREVF